EKAKEIEPLFAEIRYRLATCYLQTSNGTARAEFAAARDLDALPFRTTSRSNKTIREAAEAFKGVRLLDLEEDLEAGHGLPGNDLFLDHVHYNFEGNYLVARRLAETVAQQLPETIRDAGKTEWLAQPECE